MSSSFPSLIVRTTTAGWDQLKSEKLCYELNTSDMASSKIFAVLLLTSIFAMAMARPGYGGYIRHPISYTSYPSYSYPSYGLGHNLYSSYSYPLYGYGHGGYGLGGWLGDYW